MNPLQRQCTRASSLRGQATSAPRLFEIHAARERRMRRGMSSSTSAPLSRRRQSHKRRDRHATTCTERIESSLATMNPATPRGKTSDDEIRRPAWARACRAAPRGDYAPLASVSARDRRRPVLTERGSRISRARRPFRPPLTRSKCSAPEASSTRHISASCTAISVRKVVPHRTGEKISVLSGARGVVA